jgi:hypothetical protein
MIWQELRNPVVRDLAWACFSPPLLLNHHLPECDEGIENCHLAITPARAARLRQLDQDPAELMSHLGGTSPARLGIYFEQLWHYFLHTDPDTELLAHNLAVRDGGRTLGEFDILYLCKQRRQHIHLELAVKFYLGVPASETWLGPGQQDRLDLKIAHLIHRQIRLGGHPRGRAALGRLGIENLQQQIEVKGYLFAPETGSPAPPPGYNPGLALSGWYNIEQFQALEAPEAGWMGWHIISRQRWLSPVLISDPSQLPTHQALLVDLQKQLHAGARPLLLACCDQNGQERRRCFVTPARWPG